jgi:hypothetical protein
MFELVKTLLFYSVFPVIQSIIFYLSNYHEDGVNNIDPPTTYLLQGVPTFRTIAIILSLLNTNCQPEKLMH